MDAPIILDDQVFIVEWARELKKNHTHLNGILSLLISEKPLREDENILEARNLFKAKNNGWRDQVLYAILLDAYRKENDIKPNQIVTNGDTVGFANNFNYGERTFQLFTHKRCERPDYLHTYKIDDFQLVKKS